jgi:hypothetical protein
LTSEQFNLLKGHSRDGKEKVKKRNQIGEGARL